MCTQSGFETNVYETDDVHLHQITSVVSCSSIRLVDSSDPRTVPCLLPLLVALLNPEGLIEVRPHWFGMHF